MFSPQKATHSNLKSVISTWTPECRAPHAASQRGVRCCHRTGSHWDRAVCSLSLKQGRFSQQPLDTETQLSSRDLQIWEQTSGNRMWKISQNHNWIEIFCCCQRKIKHAAWGFISPPICENLDVLLIHHLHSNVTNIRATQCSLLVLISFWVILWTLSLKKTNFATVGRNRHEERNQDSAIGGNLIYSVRDFILVTAQGLLLTRVFTVGILFMPKWPTQPRRLICH